MNCPPQGRVGPAHHTVIFLAYALFDRVLPGQLGRLEYGWRQVVVSLTMNTEGVYGMVVGVSAAYIFLFVLFGTLLEYSGAARFFVDLSTGALGHRCDGTAIAAAVARGVFGMISGSPAANVMTTGSVTIPLMKKTGYQDDFAGAVEASASTGGQILPPIMGAAVFIIAETLGLPYILVSLVGGNMVVLLAQALTKMDVNPLAAITPPVAAALTGSHPFKLGFQAWKLSLSGYIIPFMFIFNQELLFQGSPLGIVKALVTALVGVYALSCGIEGYMRKPLHWGCVRCCSPRRCCS